jgi:hypothetical protein
MGKASSTTVNFDMVLLRFSSLILAIDPLIKFEKIGLLKPHDK